MRKRTMAIMNMGCARKRTMMGKKRKKRELKIPRATNDRKERQKAFTKGRGGAT